MKYYFHQISQWWIGYTKRMEKTYADIDPKKWKYYKYFMAIYLGVLIILPLFHQEEIASSLKLHQAYLALH